MSQRNRNSPYPGLYRFTDADSGYFFGREKERAAIRAAVSTEPLTILYGPSGVGKSSLLDCGLIPLLKKDFLTVRFSDWSQKGAWQSLRMEVARKLGSSDATPLDRLMEDSVGHRSQMAVLILDQFERYADSPLASEEFDQELARVVNRHQSKATVLIAIREDKLARLDRLDRNIPGLFGNMIRLDHLTESGARDAIRKPLEGLPLPAGGTFAWEAEFVAEVLHQAAVGASSGAVPPRVQGLLLQACLQAAWKKIESARFPHSRHLEMLEELGGLSGILESHVLNGLLDALKGDEQQQFECALMLTQLVTPGLARISLSLDDLIRAGKGLSPETSDLSSHRDEVHQLLQLLRNARILESPSDGGPYQVVHDSLAKPVRTWADRVIGNRREYERTESRRRNEEWARSVRGLEEDLERAKRDTEELKAVRDAVKALATSTFDPPKSLRLALEAAWRAYNRFTRLVDQDVVISLYVSVCAGIWTANLGDAPELSAPPGAAVCQMAGAAAVSPDHGLIAAIDTAGRLNVWRSPTGRFRDEDLTVVQEDEKEAKAQFGDPWTLREKARCAGFCDQPGLIAVLDATNDVLSVWTFRRDAPEFRFQGGERALEMFSLRFEDLYRIGWRLLQSSGVGVPDHLPDDLERTKSGPEAIEPQFERYQGMGRASDADAAIQ